MFSQNFHHSSLWPQPALGLLLPLLHILPWFSLFFGWCWDLHMQTHLYAIYACSADWLEESFSFRIFNPFFCIISYFCWESWNTSDSWFFIYGLFLCSGSLWYHFLITHVLKFYYHVSISSLCAGDMISPFNPQVCVLQFWEFCSYFWDEFLAFIFYVFIFSQNS